MINLEDLEFRKLDLKGLKILVEWAENEGWNPGPLDADVYWSTDTNGFYGIYFSGALIAGGAIVSYNKEFGFMGLFIVKPEFRTYGIGRKLWHHRLNLLIDRLNNNASIGMDGVVEMQSFYEKGGFKIEFKDERYEKTGMKFNLDPNVFVIKDRDFHEISKYDKQCFGFLRPKFLKPWINLPGNITFKYVEGNKLRGFIIARKVSNGFKIGPLFSDNKKVAEELYKACLNSAIGKPVYIDIPMINQEAVQIVKRFNAKYIFECARMYYGQPPQINIHKVYGITSFELG
ncbi:MAG: GNAT family N-acetyltransferase [Bacteroidetes bacterium]|jgi:ribosomal protein S18 acetylase RimI-like enzyme|nr:GNAT family N-acetyltransferase [Bacteroidota bacterium]MBT7143542.1 GNAT family N-acetyltransferase [Bacteroidota bacterium]MBT7490929.1 GNAT family N-acetyltransferase [Bacteroidota bacterium]